MQNPTSPNSRRESLTLTPNINGPNLTVQGHTLPPAPDHPSLSTLVCWRITGTKQIDRFNKWDGATSETRTCGADVEEKRSESRDIYSGCSGRASKSQSLVD
ncbi:hypothetical protein ACFX1W_029278 [Malus domestica]